MSSRERVLKAILNAIDDLNRQLPEEEWLEKSLETGLLGNLDSLSMVNLIVALQQKIEEEFKTKLALTQVFSDAQLMKQSFETVETLVNYMDSLLNGKKK